MTESSKVLFLLLFWSIIVFQCQPLHYIESVLQPRCRTSISHVSKYLQERKPLRILLTRYRSWYAEDASNCYQYRFPIFRISIPVPRLQTTTLQNLPAEVHQSKSIKTVSPCQKHLKSGQEQFKILHCIPDWSKTPNISSSVDFS